MLGVRSPEPHWDAIGTTVIRLIRPCGIGIERILIQNCVGERTQALKSQLGMGAFASGELVASAAGQPSQPGQDCYTTSTRLNC